MNSFWKSLLFTIGGTISLVSSLAASESVVPVTAKCDTRLNVNWHQAILSAPVMRIITQHATNYFVPIADMARELDHACDIVGAKATIAGRGFKAEIKAGDSTAIINGKRLDLSAPAQVFAGVLAISADDIGPVFRVRAGYVAATDCINVSTFRLEGKVADYKGRNVFWVNGTPMPPLMYSGTEHSRKTWSGRPRQSLEEFSAQGYRIIQTDLWFKYSLRSDGTFDLAGIRDQLAGILEVNPKAQLVVRINVSAPPWWLQQNSDEVCQVTAAKMEKNTFGGNTAESLASSKYREFTEKYLRLFLQELEQTPEADRIIGFHIGGGVYGEWHYYGIYHEPDASEPMRQRFIRFARAHYNTIEQLNAAWKTTFATFADIHVPSFERRNQTGDGDFRDPQQDLYVIQYYQCQQAVVAELVNGLAKLTKETWSRPTIVGLFYGYFYGGWTVGAQASQFDIKTLFSSPYVDYFSGPYASRNMRGSGYFRTLVDSVSLHGKVWVSEHDGGTHLGNISNSMFPDIPADEAQSLARMRRNYMYTLTDNAGQWWYDFGPKNLSGWWSTPRLLTETRRLRELSEELFAQPYEKKSEVLVVYDMEAFNYVRPARVDRLTVKMTENLSDALLGTGVPFDRIFLMDLPRLDLTKYKVIIFANTLALDSKQRDYIKQRVMKAGRSVVFMSGAGYTDGVTNDVAHISELTGMQIEKTGVAASTLTVTLSGGDFTLDATGITSRFKIADAGAQIIGNYDTKEPGAAVKDMAGCKIYYFGIPLKAEVGFFTTLLTKSNVRTYVANTTNGDYVAIGGGIIAIYSVNGGEKVIHPLRAPARTVSMPPYSTRYFDISNGADKI